MDQKCEWKTTKPPSRQLVEVRDGDGSILRVRAIFGVRELGTHPHWESEDGRRVWFPEAFPEWREIK